MKIKMNHTEKIMRMSISDAEEVVRMVTAEVTSADHQRLIDSVESESSVALLSKWTQTPELFFSIALFYLCLIFVNF